MQLRTDVDLNLLTVLDRLLETCSVTKAAEQLHLSVPATSHALARIRTTFDDQILVRSGRILVPTPRAEELRGPVRQIVEQAQNLLVRPGVFDPVKLRRAFVIRASDAFVGQLGNQLARTISDAAPNVTLRFVSEGDTNDVEPLREGRVDLNITAQLPEVPDIEQQVHFEDHFVAVVRKDHPLATGRMTAKRFVAHHHVVVNRHGRPSGPIDVGLEQLGLTRSVALVVSTFYAAAFAVSESDLVSAIPNRLAENVAKRLQLCVLRIPVPLPNYRVVSSWHRRMNDDPAHTWLRELVARALVS